MKNIFLLLFSFGLMSFTLSPSLNSVTYDWKLHKEVNGVKIFTKKSACKLEYTDISNTYLLFRYENTNAQSIQVSGRMDVWYGGNCRSCSLESPNEYEFNMELKAGEIKEGYCSDDSKAFKIFFSSEDSRMGPLDKFEISSLLVKMR